MAQSRTHPFFPPPVLQTRSKSPNIPPRTLPPQYSRLRLHPSEAEHPLTPTSSLTSTAAGLPLRRGDATSPGEAGVTVTPPPRERGTSGGHPGTPPEPQIPRLFSTGVSPGPQGWADSAGEGDMNFARGCGCQYPPPPSAEQLHP